MKRKLVSLLLVLTLVVSSAAAMSCLSWAAEKTATVYVTVSNCGDIAVTEDGEPMADVAVKVVADATVDEVMKAFHDVHCKDGYKMEEGNWGPFVSKLWGVETQNTLFFVNDVALVETISNVKIKDGDRIVASINADNNYYSDYYTYFSKKKTTVTAGEELSLTLKGFSGMNGGEAAAIAKAQLGVVTDKGFVALEGVVTDDAGNAAIKMDPTQFEAGKTYVISAKGTVPTTATDWNTEGNPTVDVDAPTIAPVCKVTVQSKIAAGVKATKITSVKATASKGKVALAWKKSVGYKVDGYQVYRSTKRSSGFTKMFTTKAKSYKNTKSLKKGTRYYYKVRGYRTVDGKTVYTNWSDTVSAVAK